MIVQSSDYLTFLQANGAVISAAGQSLLALAVPYIQQKIEKTIGYALEQNTYVEWYPSTITNPFGGIGDASYGSWDMNTSGQAVLQREQMFKRTLGLNNLPIRSITEIRENYNAWDGGLDGLTFPYFPTTSILPKNNYYADFDSTGMCMSGRVIRNVGAWAKELRSIQVTYIAGWTQAEIDASYMDLKLAMLYCISAFYIGTIMRSNAAIQGGFLGSESMTDRSKSYGDPATIGILFGNDYSFPPEAMRIISRYVNMKMFFLGA